MHRHQQILLANLADARPLGVPTVRSVVAVTAFWQTVAVPDSGIETHQDQRAVIPAHAPHGIRFWFLCAVNAAGAGDFGELIPPHELPILSGLPPFAERTAGCGGVLDHAGISVPVVCIHKATLAAEKSLAMVAGQL